MRQQPAPRAQSLTAVPEQQTEGRGVTARLAPALLHIPRQHKLLKGSMDRLPRRHTQSAVCPLVDEAPSVEWISAEYPCRLLESAVSDFALETHGLAFKGTGVELPAGLGKNQFQDSLRQLGGIMPD